MRNGRSHSGFTLVELLVSLAVMGFSISLAMGIFIAQQNSFQSLDVLRVAQEAGRDASLDFETSLRRAGFGMDPQYALDFNTYPTCANGAFCRDQTTQPDEIVFYSRNPNYHWDPQGAGTPACANADGCFTAGKGWSVGSGSTGGSLVLNARGGESFVKGQILQLTGSNGATPLMVTVLTSLNVAAAGVATITLNTTKTWTNDPYINSIANTYKYAFVIDRFRYYVAQADGTPYTAQANSTPYLMFDSGLYPDPNNPNAVERVPVAKNVEDLQIAYVLNTPAAGGAGPDKSNTNWIVGDAAGTQEQPDPSVTPVPNYVSTPPTDTSRFTVHPANVRMVRYSFVIRSYRPDPYPPAGWAGDPFPFKENRDTTTGVPPLGRYRRVVISGSVALRNMESRNSFVF
jgi:prepilin-type N-terminal cleavage/methylation domain-containing protein